MIGLMFFLDLYVAIIMKGLCVYSFFLPNFAYVVGQLSQKNYLLCFFCFSTVKCYNTKKNTKDDFSMIILRP